MGWSNSIVRLLSPGACVSPNRNHRPADSSATIHLGIYASFEFQPTLGQGETLRELTVTVQQLLDRNTKGPVDAVLAWF